VEKSHLCIGLTPVEQMVKERQSKFDFGVIADAYDLWYESAEGTMYDRMEKKAVSRFLPQNAQGMKLLEIGCGTGHWSRFFSKKGFKVSGIDISQRMIEKAQSKHITNAFFRKADGQSLPFGNGGFDVTAAIATLEFVVDAETVVQEMTRCTRKPGGQLLIGTLNSLAGLNRQRQQDLESLYAKARLFSPKQIKQLLDPYGQTNVMTAAFVPRRRSLLSLSPLIDTIGRLLRLPYGAFVVTEVRL